MKFSCFALLFALVANTSFASERAFRVNRGSISSKGYAIAWGVKNQSIDFEKIEESEEESEAIARRPDLVNYLVDIETNSILATLGEEDMVIGHIRDFKFSNYMFMDVKDFSPNGLEYDQEFFFTTFASRFDLVLDSMYLVKREFGKVNLVTECSDCSASIREQIKSFLSEEDKALYESFGGSSAEFSEVNHEDGHTTLKMTVTLYDPKSEVEREMVITSEINVTIKNRKDISVLVESVNVKK